MDDKPHVGLVDTHTECVRGNHYAYFSFCPLLLSHVALGMREARMVECDRMACLLQFFGHLLTPFARTHIDYARPLDGIYDAHQLLLLVVGMPYGIG